MRRLIYPNEVERVSTKTGYAKNAGEAAYPELWRGMTFSLPTFLHNKKGKTTEGMIIPKSPNNAIWLANSDTVQTRYGMGLIFDGSSTTYVRLPSTIQGLTPDSGFAMACWFKGTTNGYQQIISGDRLAGPTARLWQFRVDTNGKLEFIVFRGPTNSNQTSDTTITDGEWHLLLGTWDGNTQQVFVDGRLAGSKAFVGPPNTVADEVWLGAWQSVGNYLNAECGQYVFWNRGVNGHQVAPLLYRDPYALHRLAKERFNTTTVAVQDIDVSPTSLSFGAVEVNTTSCLETTISNVGVLDLTVSGLTVTNNKYTITAPVSDSLPFTISPSGSTVATICYTPTVAQTDTGSFDINSDDPDEAVVNVPLSGSGIEIPDITISPMTFNFGSIVVGNSSDLTTTISNTGTGILTVSGMTVDNYDFSIVSPVPTPFNIESAGSTVATIRYSPTVATTDTGTLTVTSNDAINTVLGLTLFGVGITPEIDTDVTSLNFGNIDIGSSSNLTTTISNIGSANLTISGLTIDNNVFTIVTPISDSLPFVISQAGSTEATITFTPVVAGTVTGNFTITNDDLDESEYIVTLSGNGIPVPEIDVSPTSLSFGSVILGNSSDLTTTISNIGTETLIVSGLTVDNNLYTIIEPVSVPFNISASGSTVTTIRFSPIASGLQSGTFTITSDDADEPTVDVSLSGSGAGAISESTINFNLYIDRARNFTSYVDQSKDFTSYIDQSVNFDLEL
jgi:hypothetical protein